MIWLKEKMIASWDIIFYEDIFSYSAILDDDEISIPTLSKSIDININTSLDSPSNLNLTDQLIGPH